MLSGAITGESLVPLDAVNLRALSQIAEGHSRVAHRIRDIQSVSENEILACGDVLSSIVDNARQLAEESERALALSVSRSEQTTTRFAQEIQEDILAQEAAVQRILDLSSQIEGAITAINDLTLSSKVLAINARIEAARLGVQGKGFAVIADSLSGLGGVIRAATDRVGSSIEAVRQGLPLVSARARSMRARTEVFIDEVAEQVRSASVQSDNGHGASRLAVLKELSNQALSHLQFQDPMQQKLLSIIGELDLVRERARRALGGGNQVEMVDAGEKTSGSEPSPGEIALFR